MKRKQFLKCPADDSGATLALVLVIVNVVALGGLALLDLSYASLRTTVALRDQGTASYASGGAAKVALDSLSTGKGFPSGSLFTNEDGTTCFGDDTTSGTLNLSNFYPATIGPNGTAPSSVSVECAAALGTGVNAAVPISAANRPGQAIMTLGKTTEVGINIETPVASLFAVKGPVRSNSTIKVLTGTLQSTAAVTAVGTCTGSFFSTPSKSCGLAANAVTDPGYAPEATAVPAYQDVPMDELKSCPNGVVTFLPGYYDDAKSLTALMTGSGPCGGSTWWFKPGTYYFDFHNNTKDPDVYRGAVTGSDRTANQWAITRGNLVAGTPTDSHGTAMASPGASPTIPGSCQNPIKRKTATGVQFIFGGDSQLALGGSADAEICGTYYADRPPIAVYGMKTGAATTTTLSQSGGSGLKMSAVLSTGNFTNNATQASLAELGGTSATWAKTSTGTETSAITMSGYAPPPGTLIPPGSIVKSVSLLVTHGNSKKYVAADRLAVTFTPKGVAGSPPGPDVIPAGLTYPNNTSLVTNTLTVQAASATSPFGQYVHENGFTGADMAYAATLTHAGTESLDTIQINITYVPPAFRSENIATITSNCMTQTYTRTSTSACAVLSTSVTALSSFTGAFYVQGTTYTPIAAIDLTLKDATQQVLRVGVISRSLWTKNVAAFSYSGPVIEIPDDAEGGISSPIVLLTVYVCPATTTSSCRTDPSAVKAWTAKARIEDPTPPAKMTILSWSNLR